MPAAGAARRLPCDARSRGPAAQLATRLLRRRIRSDNRGESEVGGALTRAGHAPCASRRRQFAQQATRARLCSTAVPFDGRAGSFNAVGGMRLRRFVPRREGEPGHKQSLRTVCAWRTAAPLARRGLQGQQGRPRGVAALRSSNSRRHVRADAPACGRVASYRGPRLRASQGSRPFRAGRGTMSRSRMPPAARHDHPSAKGRDSSLRSE